MSGSTRSCCCTFIRILVLFRLHLNGIDSSQLHLFLPGKGIPLFNSSYWAICLSSIRYKALDVKNILTETVSHHILRQMLESPMWVDLSNLLKDYLKFMDDHLRESADLTFLAYRHRNYSKVNISSLSQNCHYHVHVPVDNWLLSWLIWIM